jgi:hypothetical protein
MKIVRNRGRLTALFADTSEDLRKRHPGLEDRCHNHCFKHGSAVPSSCTEVSDRAPYPSPLGLPGLLALGMAPGSLSPVAHAS